MNLSYYLRLVNFILQHCEQVTQLLILALIQID